MLLVREWPRIKSRTQVQAPSWTRADTQPSRRLCSWGFSRQEYWSPLPCPLQEIFPTQGLSPGLPHCRQILNHLSHQGSPLFAACLINTTCLSCNKSVLILCYHETRIEEKIDLTKQKSSTPNWQDCRIAWSLLPTFLGFENILSPLNNMDRTAFVLE